MGTPLAFRLPVNRLKERGHLAVHLEDLLVGGLGLRYLLMDAFLRLTEDERGTLGEVERISLPVCDGSLDDKGKLLGRGNGWGWLGERTISF